MNVRKTPSKYNESIIYCQPTKYSQSVLYREICLQATPSSCAYVSVYLNI